MKKSRGLRAKTRTLLKKEPRERGKIGLSKLLHEYKSGDKVMIKVDSGVHRGMPHRRYLGKIGTIIDKRGRSYLIGVRQGEAIKEIIVRPEHIIPHEKE